MPKNRTELTILTPDPETAEPAVIRWPESTEKRNLKVMLKPEDIGKLALTNANLGAEIDQLEDDKKASATSYKARIEAKQAELRMHNTSVRNGFVEKPVACHWVYETSGLDTETLLPIYHPEKKTLVRDDTGEVVEITDISDSERQLVMPLDENTAEQDDSDDGR